MKKIACNILVMLLLTAQQSFAWNAPTISSPVSGTTVWIGVTLNWNSVSNSAAYQVQWDTSATFNSPLVQTRTKAYINSSGANSDTEDYPTNLFFGKTYYWRVRAYITNDTSGWTSSSFITRDYVTHSSPINGSDQWTGTTINWAPHNGVAFYDWQADTSASFSSPAFRSGSKSYINSTDGNNDTESYLNNIYFGKTYFWRVRARNAVDTSAWSVNWVFNTRNYVTHSSPVNGSDQWTGTTINWAPHNGVAFYDWQADTSASFSSPVLRSGSNTYLNSTDGNNDTESYLNNIYFGKTYYWRVRARNALDTTAWSVNWTFNTRNYVTHSSPVNGSDQWAGTTINWAPHNGVAFYDWQADTSASFSSPVLRSGSNSYVNSTDGNSDTETYLNNIYFGKTYYWRVRARNAVDTTAWSVNWTFNTRDYVTHSSPVNGGDQWAGTTLNWAPHNGVAFYDWQADTSASFTSPVLRSGSNSYVNSTDGNSDTQFYLNNIYFGKTYYWRVRARNAVDTTAWSVSWTLNVRNYVTLSSPADAALNVSINPTLNWTPHSGITQYQVQLDVSNLFNTANFLEVNKAYINSTDGNSDTQQGITGLLANTVYFWRVRAINGVDTSAWTQRWFSTGNAPVILPPAPTIATVNCGLTNQSASGVQLNWSGTSASYQLEIANSAGLFTGNPTVSNLSSSTYTTGPLTGSNYCWRVRSVEGILASEWTSPCCFTIAQPVTANITAVSQTTACAGSAITVDFSVTGFYTIGNVFTLELSNLGGIFTTPLSIGTLVSTNGGTLNGVLPSNLPSGIYAVRISANAPNYVSASSSSFSVVGLPVVVISNLSGTTELTCSTTSIQLSASGGNAYSWNAGSTPTAATNEVTTPGMYTVTATSAGCSNAQSITITQNTSAPVVTVDLETVLCNNAATDFELTGGFPVGGIWSGEAVTNGFFTANGLVAGVYSPLYSVTGANGCVGNASATITVDVCTKILDNQSNDVYVFPTCIQDGFRISATTAGQFQLILLSSDGRMVMNEKSVSSGWIGTSGLANGIYFLQLKSEQGQTRVFKLMK